jgi:hypothetical protein
MSMSFSCLCSTVAKSWLSRRENNAIAVSPFAHEHRDTVPHSLETPLEAENFDEPGSGAFNVRYSQGNVIDSFERQHADTYAWQIHRAPGFGATGVTYGQSALSPDLTFGGAGR